MVIVSVFILLQASLYLLIGTLLLLLAEGELDMAGLPTIPVDVTSATENTWAVAVSLMFFGLVAVAVFIGFLLRQRWAWLAAITWVTLSLGIGLSAYFRGQPSYLSLVLDVVLVIALNHASIQKEFREERPVGS